MTTMTSKKNKNKKSYSFPVFGLIRLVRSLPLFTLSVGQQATSPLLQAIFSSLHFR